MGLSFDKKYSDQEKEQIFIARTREKYKNVWAHYAEHISHETMTEEELCEYNFEQRKKIVKFAYENTEFYRSLYDGAGFSPDELKTEEDWNRIPVVTKQMVRDNFNEMIAGGADGETARKYGCKVRTGGSTGKPLALIRDMRYEQAGSTTWRSRGWWLERPLGELTGDVPVLGQNEGVIWRMAGSNAKTAEQLEAERRTYFPMRKLYLDAQEMTSEVMSKFVEQAAEDGIVFLRGYAGAMVEFARFCIDNRLVCRPKAAAVVANPIDDIGRRLIREAFDCEVFDVYGSTECQNIAHECRHSEHHLHVLWDMRHLDILDQNGLPVKGEETGTVHVTSFTNYIMPLIRYNLGDKTNWIKKACGCGLRFPLIHRVKGRESSVIPDKNGSLIFSPNANVFSESESVLGYQFVVHSKGVVTIRLIPDRSNPSYMDGINRIKEYYTSHYAGRVDFDLELVDSIPHDGGKMRYIIYDDDQTAKN